MKALLQRVVKASVSVDSQEVATIGHGLVVLLGVAVNDTEKDAGFLADKVAGLRIFTDKEGKFNLSVKDIGGEVLVVSQFTLLADTRKGRRPSFTDAATPDTANRLYETFVTLMGETGLKVSTGRFQQHMLVEIHNDGPVTILVDSKKQEAD